MENSLPSTNKSKEIVGSISVGILGYGEVGKAIAKFYQNPKIKDLNRDDGLGGVEILHICIPRGDDFIKTVKKEINKIKPKLTIIHSTIAPGDTKKIAISTKRLVVHSPVRGMHSNLLASIKTFVKYIGADSKKAGELAQKHLESLGIKTKTFQPSITTEIGKLLSTSYYATCIAWHGEMEKICNKAGIDFEKAVTDFNKTYNEGYKKMGIPHVIRPVLYPPKDGIEGHCLIFNTELLKKYYNSKIFDSILKYKKQKSTENSEK